LAEAVSREGVRLQAARGTNKHASYIPSLNRAIAVLRWLSRDKLGTMSVIGVEIRRLPSLSPGSWGLQETELDPSLNRDTNSQDSQHLPVRASGMLEHTSSCRPSGDGSPTLEMIHPLYFAVEVFFSPARLGERVAEADQICPNSRASVDS
jgi:hypothetical protein